MSFRRNDGLNDLRVVEAARTCSACPEQWEGELKGGFTFYFRYRFGLVQLTVAPPGEHPLDSGKDWPTISAELGDDLQGIFEDDDTRQQIFTGLLDLVAGYILLEDRLSTPELSSLYDSVGITIDRSTAHSLHLENEE